LYNSFRRGREHAHLRQHSVFDWGGRFAFDIRPRGGGGEGGQNQQPDQLCSFFWGGDGQHLPELAATPRPLVQARSGGQPGGRDERLTTSFHSQAPGLGLGPRRQRQPSGSHASGSVCKSTTHSSRRARWAVFPDPNRTIADLPGDASAVRAVRSRPSWPQARLRSKGQLASRSNSAAAVLIAYNPAGFGR
jgi:hypothetical protein